MAWKTVKTHALTEALDYLRNGGTLAVNTYVGSTMMTGKTLAKFEKAGCQLLKEDGDGYRIARGRHFDYLMPGTLKYWEEEA